MRLRDKLCIALAGCLACGALLPGCGKGVQPTSDTHVEIIELPMAASTPTPSPTLMPLIPEIDATPQPDMTFDESGNIWFSDAMKARFAAQTYSFDRAPRVLIYHTHAREAFREPDPAQSTPVFETTPAADAPNARPSARQTPAPTNAAQTRSDNPDKTVVHLGDLLAAELNERGFLVFHDRADVEAPQLSTAYERSRIIMQAYDDIDIYIDLHRNAADPVKGRDDVVLIDGKRTARMFFVVGTGINEESDADAIPHWRDNYAFALSLYEQLTAVDARLARENRVKQGYYNQQAGLCLLAEIGHNANLMSDAENAVILFADALAAVCRW